MNKTEEKRAHVADKAEDFSPDRFGWVWMWSSGEICGTCKDEQPQSRAACIGGHVGSAICGDGRPFPWTAK